MQMLICLSSNISLLVIPDTNNFKDLHPILIDKYSLYYCDQLEIDVPMENNELADRFEKHFMGHVKLGTDNTSFKYIADDKHCLAINDVVQVIKAICHYRDTPALWIN
jgi:hypothetical protein